MPGVPGVPAASGAAFSASIRGSSTSAKPPSAPSRMAGTCCGFMQDFRSACAHARAVLDAMGRDAMDAGDEAVNLASDEDMTGAAEAEAMATEKAF
eukprot:350266-Chlamydomonas_euryale.AAC.17